MSEAAEKRIAELERELAGTQEMLALVLQSVGEAVVVPHEAVTKGLPKNAQISVEDNMLEEAFVFSLVVVDE